MVAWPGGWRNGELYLKLELSLAIIHIYRYRADLDVVGIGSSVAYFSHYLVLGTHYLLLEGRGLLSCISRIQV